MTFQIEDKPVLHRDPLIDEAVVLLHKLEIGQSFLVPGDIANAVRCRAVIILGKRFKTVTEDGQMRIGRVA